MDRADVVASDDGRPRLEWTLTATQSPILRLLNAASPRLPLWTWRSSRLVRAREHIARRILGMGDIRMSATMPSGHVGILMPQRMYFVDQVTAVLDDEDLGQAVRVSPNPQIGQVPLPARGVLAVGQAAWAIPGNDERALTPGEVTRKPGG